MAADIIVFGIISGDFLFYIDKVWWGDSNENTQHTFMLEKLKEISLLCLLSCAMINTH